MKGTRIQFERITIVVIRYVVNTKYDDVLTWCDLLKYQLLQELHVELQ